MLLWELFFVYESLFEVDSMVWRDRRLYNIGYSGAYLAYSRLLQILGNEYVNPPPMLIGKYNICVVVEYSSNISL